MKLPAGNSSLSGLSSLIALATCTRDMAVARDMPNLAAKLTDAIDDAYRARELSPGEPSRTSIASRLYDFNRSAYSMLHRKTQTQ